MIRFFFAVSIMVSIWGCSHTSEGPQPYENPLGAIVRDGKPTPQLKQLLAHEGLATEGLPEIVKATQKAWLRPQGTERWQLPPSDVEDRGEIWALFDKLSLRKEVGPSQQDFEHLLLLGAMYSTLRARLEYALELWKQGIRWKRLALLGGQRPTEPQVEWKSFRAHYPGTPDHRIPKTEIDMMHWVYTHMDLPKEMRDSVQIVTVDVPMKLDRHGKPARPNTQDTLEAWLRLKPTPGACLLVSSQPFIAYQHSIAKSYLPENFYSLQTVGTGTTESQNPKIFFDSLARVLYQENLRHAKGPVIGSGPQNNSMEKN